MSGGPLHRSDENQAEPYVWRSTKTYQPEDIGGRTYSVVTQQCARDQEEKLCKPLDDVDVVRDVENRLSLLFQKLRVEFLQPATVASFSSTASFTMAANSWSDTAPATS